MFNWRHWKKAREMKKFKVNIYVSFGPQQMYDTFEIIDYWESEKILKNEMNDLLIDVFSTSNGYMLIQNTFIRNIHKVSYSFEEIKE